MSRMFSPLTTSGFSSCESSSVVCGLILLSRSTGFSYRFCITRKHPKTNPEKRTRLFSDVQNHTSLIRDVRIYPALISHVRNPKGTETTKLEMDKFGHPKSDTDIRYERFRISEIICSLFWTVRKLKVNQILAIR